MGFLDNITESINRGTEAIGRGTKSAQLKLRLGELVKERQKLAAQLGAGLYDKLKDDAAMREGLEQLFDGIAAIDSQRDDIQSQIDILEAQGAASAAAAVTYKCPDCGASVGAADLFCSGCGKPIAEVRAAAEAQESAMSESSGNPAHFPAADGPMCLSCGAPLKEGDAFCMSCGQQINQEIEER